MRGVRYSNQVSLEAFGVKNLRCLKDTGFVPIRPITVLVGRNSSGKSTFLRAFPLLRQSVETARNSPILWYHERYVDFGSLKDAASNRLSEPSVTFQFRLGLPPNSEFPDLEIAMSLTGAEDPYVSAYEIRAAGATFRWEFDANGVARSLAENGQPVELKHVDVLPRFRQTVVLTDGRTVEVIQRRAHLSYCYGSCCCGDVERG